MLEDSPEPLVAADLALPHPGWVDPLVLEALMGNCNAFAERFVLSINVVVVDVLLGDAGVKVVLTPRQSAAASRTTSRSTWRRAT